MSPPLDFPLTENSARTRTDTRTVTAARVRIPTLATPMAPMRLFASTGQHSRAHSGSAGEKGSGNRLQPARDRKNLLGFECLGGSGSLNHSRLAR